MVRGCSFRGRRLVRRQLAFETIAQWPPNNKVDKVDEGSVELPFQWERFPKFRPLHPDLATWIAKGASALAALPWRAYWEDKYLKNLIRDLEFESKP